MWFGSRYQPSPNFISGETTLSGSVYIDGDLIVSGSIGFSSSQDPTSASNLGGGEGIFLNKVGMDLRFKSLVGVGDITLSSSATEIFISSSSPVLSHGSLTDLSADDHLQYLLVDGTRAMSGTLDMSGNAIINPGLVDGRDVSIDGATLDAHIIDLNNPHSTSLGNLGTGTLSQLNSLITDATLDDVSGARAPTGSASGDLSGSYPNPQVVAMTLADLTNLTFGNVGEGQVLIRSGSTISGTFDNGQNNTASNIGTGAGVFQSKAGVDLRFKSLIGSGSVTILSSSTEIAVSGATELPPIGPAGGDLSGSYPNPEVVALTSTSGSGIQLTLGDIDDDEFLIRSGSTIISSPGPGGTRVYPNSATDPVSPPPEEGDQYYNTALNMLMYYDASRGKWLSVESATFEFGRNGNTAAGSFYKGVDGRAFSATIGFTAFDAGTIIAAGYTRGDTDLSVFQVTANGAETSFLSSSATSGRTSALNGNFAQGNVLGVKNKSGTNTTSEVQGWVKVKWRI